MPTRTTPKPKIANDAPFFEPVFYDRNDLSSRLCTSLEELSEEGLTPGEYVAEYRLVAVRKVKSIKTSTKVVWE